MTQWLWAGVVILFIVLLFVFYKRIASFFVGFYHHKAAHLIMITRNCQSAIEWRIWSYFFWSQLVGKKGVVTCIDTGSVDDTLKILSRLQSRYPRLYIVKLHPTVTLEEEIQESLQKSGHSMEHMFVLDLQEEDFEEPKKTSA